MQQYNCKYFMNALLPCKSAKKHRRTQMETPACCQAGVQKGGEEHMKK